MKVFLSYLFMYSYYLTHEAFIEQLACTREYIHELLKKLFCILQLLFS